MKSAAAEKRSKTEWRKYVAGLVIPVLLIAMSSLLRPFTMDWRQWVSIVAIGGMSLGLAYIAFRYASRLGDRIYDLDELTEAIEQAKGRMLPHVYVVEDYGTYMRGRPIKSVWVMGTTLEHTEGPEGLALLLDRLSNGAPHRFLCCGEYDDVVSRATRIAQRVKQASPAYLDLLEMSWVHTHHVQFSQSIYNADSSVPGCTCAEVLVVFSKEVENALETKAGVLLREDEAVRHCVHKFDRLWNDKEAKRLSVAVLASQRR